MPYHRPGGGATQREALDRDAGGEAYSGQTPAEETIISIRLVVSVGHLQFIGLTSSIGYFVSVAMTVNACELEAAEGHRSSQGLTGCLH